MKLLHRFFYYFGGFAIGIVFLIFFLSGKKTSCEYGPNARVLKNIRTKPRAFSQNALQFFESNKLDTASIAKILKTGDVDFSRSQTHLDSCRTYVINSMAKKNPVEVSIRNCDSLATIYQAEFKKEE